MTNKVEVSIQTPFGLPSDTIAIATLGGVRCAFLPRHGRDHHVTPSEVNYRANIWALKSLGVKYLITVHAVGSLRREMAPGDMVLVTQHIDKTFGRASTFFGKGCVAHVPFGKPTCEIMIERAAKAMTTAVPGLRVHAAGTLVTMEGPAFSTKAESMVNRQAGGDLIGMTAVTEGKLAREAEMAHCIIAMVTDYDSWSDEHDHVDVSMVVSTMKRNSANAQLFVPAVLTAVAAEPFESKAHSALSGAVMTTTAAIPADTYRSLEIFLAKYANAPSAH